MSCPALLNGVLWNLGYTLFANEFSPYVLTAEEWRKDLDDLCHLDLKKIMLFTGIPQAMKTPGRAAEDILDFIYRECAQRGMEVIIATGGHPHWDFEMQDAAAEGKLVKGYVDELYKRYGDYPSFRGWYIDYEFCIRKNELGQKLRELYRIIVELCKEKTPDLPVAASPFFYPPTEGNVMNVKHNYPPQEYYEYWSDMIAYSHFDILSLQDNGGQHFSYFTAKDTEPYIAAYARACRENNCRFWGNVETGELEIESAEDFRRRFGQDGNCNRKECAPFWRPVPMDRLKKRLELMSRYSECNLSWGFQAFYRPRLGEKAAKAYSAYEKYLKDFKK